MIGACRLRDDRAVKQERLDFLADDPLYSKRFAFYVGPRRSETWPRDGLASIY